MNSGEQSRRVQNTSLRRWPMYFALQVLVEPTPLLTRPRPITTIPYSDYSFKLFLSSFWAILYFMVILHMLIGYAIINHACLYTSLCLTRKGFSRPHARPFQRDGLGGCGFSPCRCCWMYDCNATSTSLLSERVCSSASSLISLSNVSGKRMVKVLSLFSIPL
jgi:hypothetical protein